MRKGDFNRVTKTSIKKFKSVKNYDKNRLLLSGKDSIPGKMSSSN